MRPVLECAGQVVFFFHNLMMAPNVLTTPERAVEVVGARLNADHYQWFRRRTKGEVSPDELREVEAQAQEAAASFAGAPKPKRRKGRRLNQADKVATLKGGRQWYRYLSERFSHGKTADWRGLSWRGGVMTIDRVEAECVPGLVRLLGGTSRMLMRHCAWETCSIGGRPPSTGLREAAILGGTSCSHECSCGIVPGRWRRGRPVEPLGRTYAGGTSDVRESSRALREAAMSAQQGRLDGSARTD